MLLVALKDKKKRVCGSVGWFHSQHTLFPELTIQKGRELNQLYQ